VIRLRPSTFVAKRFKSIIEVVMLMPNRVSPGIVNVTDFVAAHAKKAGSYINYIDRDEAIRIDYFDHQNIL
jgi:hypothetical protein